MAWKGLLAPVGGILIGFAFHWMGADWRTTLTFVLGLACAIISCPGVRFESKQ